MVVTAKIVNPDPISGYITVVLDGKPQSINAGNKFFSQALDAFREENWDAFMSYANPTMRLNALYASYEGIEVKEGNLYVFGDPVHSTLATRVLSLLENNLDCTPLFKFILKLNLNPSKRAVDELYTFLEHKNLPLTLTGNFLAYKAVRADYTDIHSGKFLNTVDSVLEMPRNKVDDDKNVGCSYGFHAGTIEYAKGFVPRDGHLLLVEINPADVVSIPVDCNFQKLRTCKYKVVDEYEIDLSDPVYASRFSTEHDDDVDLWGDEDDEEYPTCSDCGEESYGNCEECDCCEGCCDCSDDEESQDDTEPKTEVQLKLNFDNKMTTNWADTRFQYLVMLPWLYAHRRPALGNALKNFYKDIDDHHQINPIFAILKQFTSDEDAYKIYCEFTNS
jgi:hypothetical protein